MSSPSTLGCSRGDRPAGASRPPLPRPPVAPGALMLSAVGIGPQGGHGPRLHRPWSSWSPGPPDICPREECAGPHGSPAPTTPGTKSRPGGPGASTRLPSGARPREASTDLLRVAHSHCTRAQGLPDRRVPSGPCSPFPGSAGLCTASTQKPCCSPGWSPASGARPGSTESLSGISSHSRLMGRPGSSTG